jgi:hypothetical protein
MTAAKEEEIEMRSGLAVTSQVEVAWALRL